ncbi:MAG: transglycosylase SLT domain-containing protein [Salinisphaeraceae bacterium]
MRRLTRPIHVLLAALLLWAPAGAALDIVHEADFRRAAIRYLPMATSAWGHEILAAQCYQESLFDSDAVSPVGAMGLCQFMPATWDEAVSGLGWARGASAFDPKLSILAAAWYMQRQRSIWKSPRPEWDRHTLAMAGYNAGAGNILAAQREAGGALMACSILGQLHRVTGHHATETRTYVRRIWRWHRQMMVL